MKFLKLFPSLLPFTRATGPDPVRAVIVTTPGVLNRDASGAGLDRLLRTLAALLVSPATAPGVRMKDAAATGTVGFRGRHFRSFAGERPRKSTGHDPTIRWAERGFGKNFPTFVS